MSNLPQAVLDQVRARLGTTLKDKWRIDAVLGVGGMAAVYAATHRTGNRVAIKMLHPQLSLNESVRKRFAQEGYVANTVEHDGVARVIDDDVADDGAAFIVMELLEGETAAGRADRLGGKLPVSEVAFLGQSVASVLAAAHAKGIIHRDIKPDNVFITSAGRVVVLDFGIARIKDATGISASNTRTGTMMGTPAFMPPEQARGRANEMDATSDVWALGATLFYLASGRPVHEAETPNEQLVAAATLPAPSLARIAPDVPAPLADVIDRSLEFAKENRYPDARAFETALREALLAIAWAPDAQPGLGPITERPPPPEASPDAHAGRGPTIGPVEMAPPSSRATRYVRAAIVGAVLGAGVLGAAALVGRKIGPRASVTAAPAASPQETAPPIAPASVVASVAPSPTVEPVASSEPTSSEPAPAATSSSSSGVTARPHTPRTKGQSWLDRRK